MTEETNSAQESSLVRTCLYNYFIIISLSLDQSGSATN